jgi:hypothetical protein
MVKKLKTQQKLVIKKEISSESEPEEKTFKFSGAIDEDFEEDLNQMDDDFSGSGSDGVVDFENLDDDDDDSGDDEERASLYSGEDCTEVPIEDKPLDPKAAEERKK